MTTVIIQHGEQVKSDSENRKKTDGQAERDKKHKICSSATLPPHCMLFCKYLHLLRSWLVVATNNFWNKHKVNRYPTQV